MHDLPCPVPFLNVIKLHVIFGLSSEASDEMKRLGVLFNQIMRLAQAVI
jgi:hypothetical protein